MDRAPVFVKIDDYQDVVDIVALMRDRISQARMLLDKIREIKAREDEEISTWLQELQQVESRVQHIDSVLSEPER